MENEREAWLKGLKVGDEVAIVTQSGFRRTVKIERITPTGRIKTDYGYEFDTEGHERGASDYWSRGRIVPYSKEIQEGLERRTLANGMSRVRWDSLSLAKLREIDAILKRKDGTE